MKHRLFALTAMMVILTIPAFSQTSPGDGSWSGQIQCQLDVQQQGYARHEVQTWTLTSSMPVSKNGDMQIYSATWTATGQGGFQRALDQRSSLAQWNINVPPANATIAMFIRRSDGRFIIRIWQRPAPSYTGIIATRQIAGQAQGATKINSAVHEWTLPWIEAKPGATASGKMSVPAESLGADLTPPGTLPTAECTWQFSSKVSTIQDEQSLTNARVMKDYTDGLQQSWAKQRAVATSDSGGQSGPQPQISPTAGVPIGQSQTITEGRSGGAEKTSSVPSLAQVSPNHADIGTKNLNLTLTGTFTHFSQGTTVELVSQQAIEAALGKAAASYAEALAATSQVGGGGGDIPAGQSLPATLKPLSVRVISPTQVVAVFNIDPPVFPGAYIVEAKTGPEQAALIGGFTLTQPNSNSMPPSSARSPKVTQVAPNSAEIGATNVKLTITGSGTHFVQKTGYLPGTTVELWSQEAYVSAVMQKINAVRNAVNQSTGSSGGTSSGSIAGPSVEATFVSVSSSSTAMAIFNLDSSLAPGPYVVVTRTGSEEAVLNEGFMLSSSAYAAPANATTTEAPAGAPLSSATVVPFTPGIQTSSVTPVVVPVIAQVTPNAGSQGANNLSVILTGNSTHFVQGTTTADFGPGITLASPLTVTSPTIATAVLNIDPQAAAGTHTVTVTTGAEAATLKDGFTVNIALTSTLLNQSLTLKPLDIDSVRPTWAQKGAQNVSLDVSSSKAHFVQGRTTADLGGGITVTSIQVQTPNYASIKFNIDVGAVPGFRTVIVKTGSETAQLNSGFVVAPDPDPYGKFQGAATNLGPLNKDSVFTIHGTVNNPDAGDWFVFTTNPGSEHLTVTLKDVNAPSTFAVYVSEVWPCQSTYGSNTPCTYLNPRAYGQAIGSQGGSVTLTPPHSGNPLYVTVGAGQGNWDVRGAGFTLIVSGAGN
jgi:hypothetical protein